MHELLVLLSAIVIVFAAWRVLMRTRDPLAPMVAFSPMLLYMFVFNPWMRYRSGALSTFFPDPDDLLIVFVVFFLGVTAFAIGLSWGRVPRNAPDRRFQLLPAGLPPRVRRKVYRIACLLGLIANTAHWYMIYYSGGWDVVFAKRKPYLGAPSGYIGELPMLVYPALLLLAIAWQGRRLTPPRLVLALMIATPVLTMATFGGRRGPMFLIVCTFGACWCIVKSRRPKLKTLIIGGTCLGLLLFLLGKNRGNLFRPWEHDVDFSVVTDRLGGNDEAVTSGEEFIAGSAMIIGSHKLDHHFWGARYAATFIVRPIPGFIWPSKYRDLGLGWMESSPGSCGIADSEWLSALGFIPAGGNAGGFIPDLFLEFSWGAVLCCFLLGRLISACWVRWRMRGGLWVLLYFETLILSVYLPSQSVGAGLYRFMLLAVPTWFIWNKIIVPGNRSSHVPPHLSRQRLSAMRS